MTRTETLCLTPATSFRLWATDVWLDAEKVWSGDPEEPGGWLIIEVGGKGLAKASARGCEVVAGEGSGMGGRHNARVGEQWPICGVGLRREHVEPDAAEVPRVEVCEGGIGVEQGATGDVDEPGAGRIARSTGSSMSGGCPAR